MKRIANQKDWLDQFLAQHEEKQGKLVDALEQDINTAIARLQRISEAKEYLCSKCGKLEETTVESLECNCAVAVRAA